MPREYGWNPVAEEWQPLGGSSSERAPLVVSDLGDIPGGTPSGTVVVLSTGAPVPTTPYVVSASSDYAGSPSTSVTIPPPTDIQDGDMLLAFIANQHSIAVEFEAGNGGEPGTIPAGFSRVAWPVYAQDAGIRWQAVYAKTASAESGDYTFGWDQNYGRSLGSMLLIRNATSVLAYAGPASEADNIAVLPTVSVTADDTLAIGFTHNVHTATNDGRCSYTGWDTEIQVIGTNWETASEDSLTLVSRSYNDGQTAGGQTATLNQGSMAADASATLLIGNI